MHRYIVLLLILCTSFSFAQQEKYTKYLKNALAGLDNGNVITVSENLKFFAAAVEKDNLIPEKLSNSNLELFTIVLYESSLIDVPIDEDIKNKIILFLSYNAMKSPNQMVALGSVYLKGSANYENWQKAVFWLKEAAKHDNPTAYYNLGYAYSQFTDHQDFVKALEYYSMASEKGISNANYAAGFLFENQIKDYKKARYWFLKGADGGDYVAMFALANLFFNGQGGIKDYQKSLYWYTKSSDKGYTKASAMVGYQYQTGMGTEVNIDEAEKYYLLAAQEDNIAAILNLSLLYSDDSSRKFNLTKAIFWAKKGCNLNDHNSCEQLKQLENEK